MCVFSYVYASVCVCVPDDSVSAFGRACVRVVLRAIRLFTRVRIHVRTWAEGGKEKYV